MRVLITALMLFWAGVAAGQAPTYDGVDQSVHIDSAVTDLATQNGSISLWINPDDNTPSAEEVVFCYSDASANEKMYVSLFTDGKLQLIMRDPSQVKYILKTDSTTLFESGSWSHVCVTHNGARPYLHVDGALPAQTFTTDNDRTWWLGDLSNTDTVRIGCHNANGGGDILHFTGKIDDVRPYSTALSSNQIARLTLDTCEMYDPTLWTNSTLHAIAETWDTGYGNTNIVAYARGDMTGVGNGQAITNTWQDTKGNTFTPVNGPTLGAAR